MPGRNLFGEGMGSWALVGHDGESTRSARPDGRMGWVEGGSGRA